MHSHLNGLLNEVVVKMRFPLRNTLALKKWKPFDDRKHETNRFLNRRMYYNDNYPWKHSILFSQEEHFVFSWILRILFPIFKQICFICIVWGPLLAVIFRYISTEVFTMQTLFAINQYHIIYFERVFCCYFKMTLIMILLGYCF